MRLKKCVMRKTPKIKPGDRKRKTTKNTVLKEPTCLEDGQEGESHQEQTSTRGSHHVDLEIGKWG